MSSRIIVRGKERWRSRDFRPSRVELPPTNREGEVIEEFIIQPGSARAAFRAGVSFYDEEEKIEYRVVSAKALVIAQGWGTAAFWTKRWSTDFKSITDLVRRGLLDAAIEEGTVVRRYRCRDEIGALARLSESTGALEASGTTMMGVGSTQAPTSRKRSRASSSFRRT